MGILPSRQRPVTSVDFGSLVRLWRVRFGDLVRFEGPSLLSQAGHVGTFALACKPFPWLTLPTTKFL